MKKIKDSFLKVIAFSIILLLLYSFSGIAQPNVPLEGHSTDTTFKEKEIKFYLKNPSTWVQNNINKLNSLILPIDAHIDTFSIQNKLKEISSTGDIIKASLEDNSSYLRMKYIIEFNNELLTDIDILIGMQRDLQKLNNYLTNQTLVSVGIADEVAYFNTHADTTIKAIYREETIQLNNKLNQTNALLSDRLMRLVKLESAVNMVAFRLQEYSNYAQVLIKQKKESLYQPNYQPIWNLSRDRNEQPIVRILARTGQQSLESMRFFVTHGSLLQVLFRLLVFLICLLPVYNFYKKNKGLFKNTKSLKYLPTYPFFASAIIGLTLVPILFVHAPFIFIDLLFIFQIIVVSIIIREKHNYLSMKSFYIVLTSYFFLKVFNLMVSPTNLGQIYMYLSILLLIPVYNIYRDLISHQEDKSLLIKIVSLFVMGQLTIGWFLSVIGYFLLGRYYFISAFDALLVALSLYIAIYTTLDYLRILTTMINKRLVLFHINREIVEKYIGNVLIASSLIFFIYWMLRNYNVYDQLKTSVLMWLSEPRALGNSVFSYLSMLLFFAYLSGFILISNFISKVIDTNDNKKIYKRRTYLGSFMLLFRFTMVTIGFILAIMASGIPVTQLTVIMGALGVGIGFGLQNIFNNMVSGLIIAIEKPISVGDMVEVGTNTGWVKSIGIRSSNIQSFDGAEIIVPNGEIISNRITNWTLSDKKRRLEIIIGVAFRSDPHQVYALLYKVVAENAEILKNPEPFIVFTGLGDSSLNFKIQFWIADYVDGIRIKSEVLLMIFDKLKENNIEIPYPQHDLHLKSVHPELMKHVGTNGDK